MYFIISIGRIHLQIFVYVDDFAPETFFTWELLAPENVLVSSDSDEKTRMK